MRARRQISELERNLAATQADLEATTADVAVLAGALDVLPIGVLVRARDGHELICNLAARQGTGDRQADALVARAIDDAFDAASSAGASTQTLELHQPTRRAVSITAERLPGGATVVITEDVSARVQIDAVRRDFVANVSHELRTPVGALSVLAETIIGEGDLGVVRRLAERMAVEADRAVRLIEDLLDLSRVEATGGMRREPVRVAQAAAAASALVAEVARAAQVMVNTDAVAAHLEVLGDERQLTSAVRNLLDNAVKYSGAGGQVEVSARLDGGFVCIAVRDSGIGIPARDLDRIFERFFRVDRARSRQTGGTGLGLAIVRHVAQNHGGDVTVQSVEGEGSTFTMRLRAP